MDLKEKLDRQISRAVRDAVIALSRDEVPDAGSLALAIASGQSAESLVQQAQEKIDNRAAKPEPAKPAPATTPVQPFVHPLTPGQPVSAPDQAVAPESQHTTRLHHEK